MKSALFILALMLSSISTAAPTGSQVHAEYARAQADIRYTGDKLSLNFQDVDVRAVLKALADFTQLNIVVSDSVSGQITIRLKEVPWDQALDILLQSKGLGMRRSGNVLWVAPREELATRDHADLEVRRRIGELETLRTEAFQLNYSKAEEVARGLLGHTIGSAGVGSASGGSTSTLPPLPSAAGTGTSVTSSVGAASSRILSSRGSVIAVARTNQLFVTDIPAKLEQIKAMIKTIDVPVKQVLIEARIVEAHDTFGRSLGAKLGFNDTRSQQGAVPGFPLGASARAAVGGNYLAVGQQTLQPGAPQAYTNTQFVNLPAPPIGAFDPASLAVSIFGASAQRFLNLEISALESDGRGKVVSSPRIVTADQVEAYIKQGFRIPYRGLSNGFHTSTQVQFQEASLKLAVTPQITPEGQVILSVMVNKDSLGAITPDGREINTKELKTQVLVENGGTVVIGGIYEEEESTQVAKVPVLGDLPMLGALFRSSTRESKRTELLVFLTPKVMATDMAQR